METIAVRGAAEHNLKGVDLDIPRGALVAVSGVSGSGKSSLVFDTIAREAQRRYLETFSSYARLFLGRLGRPAVRSIAGLSPAITVDQKAPLRSVRSTVGTLTGLYDDLRLLFARLGRAPAGLAVERRLFSFNSPYGACPVCKGLGLEDRLDPELLVSDARKSIRDGALAITTPSGYVIYSQVTIDVLDQVCRAHGFDVDTPWQDLAPGQRHVVLYGSDRLRIPYGKHPLSSRMRWSGITPKPREEGVYKGILPVMEQILGRSRNRNILRFVRSLACRACGGTRLRPEALAVRFGGRNIAEFAALEIDQLEEEFEALRLGGADAAIGDPIRAALVARTGLLRRLGLGHLTLDRVSTTLSGGEAQRVRLASQVGSELRGVLYALDEPSAGLHPAEHRLLLDALRTLRDNGNTVLVVDHDRETLLAADWIVDIGPDAGDRGGQLLFSGDVRSFLAGETGGAQGFAFPPSASRTRAFLTGTGTVPARSVPRPGAGRLALGEAVRHNLRGVDVEFLLGALNVVTGPSGAGKSSLVEELVDRHASGRLRAVGPPIGKTIHVDQLPIGRTPRSNPATYTGLSDSIRDLFASLPEARARGFGKGRFSFNVRGGRCDACEGAGVQQVGMHFLGPVDVVCGRCGGRRFNDATLEITYRGLNIHDVLELTLDQAVPLLADSARASRVVGALRELGLGYLRLGQPSTTLSGGEAQRVKLAAELSRPGRPHTLYVLDEPTTGLHAADVAVLVAAMTRLVEQGHTVVAVEHDLDVIRAADRVIDLGPGGGRRGGRLVAAGTPAEVAACRESLTGAALRREDGALPTARGAASPPHHADPSHAAGAAADLAIRFEGVRTHNLRGIDVTIPARLITVVTGISGSGKSSFAFDTLYAEGRNRFTESFSPYARRFLDKPADAEFDRVTGLTPVVAVRQRRPSRNPRSTVGTMTEIADWYRLLFSRVGVHACPSCGGGAEGGLCPRCGWRSGAPFTSTMFSPNAEQGACEACDGLGTVTECDPAKLISHADRPLAGGAMAAHASGRFYGDPDGQHMATLAAVGRELGFDFGVPWAALGEEAREIALRGAGDREFDVDWHYRRGTRAGVHRFRSKWIGLVGLLGQEYTRKHADRRGEALEPLMRRVECPSCHGARLKAERLDVRVGGLDIAAWLGMTVGESVASLARLDASLSARAAALTADLRGEIVARLERLRDAGLDYLALARPAATLSAGEAQRVRLATEVTTGLTGITYVLDEPTAGLHPRDTRRLLGLLAGLREAGNTVVVVEHDPEVIRAADHVIDLGPGAGKQGGRIVAAGTPAEIAASDQSPTGQALRAWSEGAAPGSAGRARRLGRGISVAGACCHNLRHLSVDIPSGGLVAVTGVSGSGKSTLVFDVIGPAVAALLARGPIPAEGAASPVPGREGSVVVHAPFTRLIGAGPNRLPAAPSSTTVTLMGIAAPIHEAFAATPAARAAGLSHRWFSTLVKGGRCEACEGLGRTRVSMDFLPDVWVECPECRGRRYQASVLGCAIDGRSIADVLSMTASEAAGFFSEDERVARPLRLLEELGLGYLELGQGAGTLSGGERQRVLLARELLGEAAAPALFLFDEPTTGLHAADVGRLVQVFDRLADAGHTLVVVEHNLDVIRVADHVIDLGPEGGDRGGRVVAIGRPQAIARAAGSWTGAALANPAAG